MAPEPQRGDEDDPLVALRDRLDRYPAERYPVQHATTRFHLATLHLQAGRTAQALEELGAAMPGFAAASLCVERAKTRNMMGIAHREQGELDHAGQAFTDAAELFSDAGEVTEEAAARFNLGLVHRQLHRLDQALDCFGDAAVGFDSGGTRPQHAAASRELAGVLVESGRPAEAVDVLRPVIEDADARGDLAAIGAAANVLGLALLGTGRRRDAGVAFTQAVAGNPRVLRPAEYATAKANLALTLEPDDPCAARVAARQATGVPAADEVVRAQAHDILARLAAGPTGAPDLLAVLDAARPDGWIPRWRDEHARLLDAAEETRATETQAFIEEALGRADASDHLHAWFGAVLEQPPEQMASLLAAFLTAADRLNGTTSERLRSLVARVLPRFPIPQWLRLRDALNHLAATGGHPGGWS